MNIYIFKRINKCSDRYHEGDGLVVVAENVEELYKMINEHKDIEITPEEMEEVIVYQLMDKPESTIFVFPDAGCC